MRVLTVLCLFVYLAMATLVRAQSRTIGAWNVVISDNKEDLIAATSVDGMKFLAYRCFGRLGQCAHSIALDVECEDGKSYPLLVNSSYAAMALNCTCLRNGAIHELIPEFDLFNQILKSSTGQIGFALPMASGQFKVVRFELNGARDAMKLAERAVTKFDSAEYR